MICNCNHDHYRPQVQKVTAEEEMEHPNFKSMTKFFQTTYKKSHDMTSFSKVSSSYSALGSKTNRTRANNGFTVTDKDKVSYLTNYHGDTDNVAEPGPSNWSPGNTFIADGNLHLLLSYDPQTNTSKSAEAQVKEPSGYGDYHFTVTFVDGAGSFMNGKNVNTTFGAYTYNNKPKVWNCATGNNCNEADMVEWGKSRSASNPGPAQWGIQPWNDGSGNVDQRRLPRWQDFSQADWDEIGRNGNAISFSMNLAKDNVEFWATPGDYNKRTFNRDNAKWHFQVDKSQQQYFPFFTEGPEEGTTHLMFNLWAPVGPDNTNSSSEVIVTNVSYPRVKPSSSMQMKSGSGISYVNISRVK